MFGQANNALWEVNPCFDIYEITDNCPILSDVLGFPTELVQDQYNTTYFNRSDVKQAMHAPADVSWSECSVGPVFVGGAELNGYYTGGPQGEGDTAPDPIQHVLPQVITVIHDTFHNSTQTWFDQSTDLRALLARGNLCDDPGHAQDVVRCQELYNFTPGVWARGAGSWFEINDALRPHD